MNKFKFLRKFLLLLIIHIGIVNSQISFQLTFENLLEEEWNAFKLTYNKTYKSYEEEIFRREIFIENRQKVIHFNEEYAIGRKAFVQQLNIYGDMLHHEFNKNLNGFNASFNNVEIGLSVPTTFIPSANIKLPQTIDWNEMGAVTPVKSQQLCAACWAFSAAGALEGQTFRKTGQLTELSPQNLIDCTKPYGNDGCAGGFMNPAYEYVKNNPGIDIESSYPYEAKDNQCRFKPESVGAYCTGYVNIPEGDERALEIAVATIGPVSVAIDASHNSLQFYSDGIYYDPECKNTKNDMNHAVLVVGYGIEPDGQRYWLVKNSYGNQWGIGGYIKIAKDANNHCGIATIASYPLV